MLGPEVLKEHYLTWKALSRVSSVVMARQTSHRSPRKCLTDVALAGKHLSCLSREREEKEITVYPAHSEKINRFI